MNVLPKLDTLIRSSCREWLSYRGAAAGLVLEGLEEADHCRFPSHLFPWRFLLHVCHVPSSSPPSCSSGMLSCLGATSYGPKHEPHYLNCGCSIVFVFIAFLLIAETRYLMPKLEKEKFISFTSWKFQSILSELQGSKT